MGACVSLPSFKTPSQQTFVSNDWLECTLYATQGHRSSMEDRHVMTLSLPNHPSYSLFGVFDGFNGDDASNYFSEHIVETLDAVTDLEDNDAIINAVGEMDTNYIHSENTAQWNTNAGCTFVFAVIHTIATYANDKRISPLKLTLNTANASYSNLYSTETSSSTSKSEDGPLNFGSFVDTNNAYRVRVFWAGDSRAVLMSDSGQFDRLTADHHCSMPKEAERIVNAKGTIRNGRVDGVCEVTRCFGGHSMKNDTTLPPNKQKMISVPDQTTFMCGSNDRLLIFCDGLVKRWSDKQFKVRCKHHMMRHKDEKHGELNALMYLCEQAIDEGSKDNMTVLSVQFK